MSSESLLSDLKSLTDVWCERKALRPLSYLLPSYLGLNGLTDGFADLETALSDVLAFAREDITSDEKSEVQRLRRVVQKTLYDR